MKRKLLALFMAGSFLFTCAACGDTSKDTTDDTANTPSSTNEGGNVSVAVIFKALNAEYWKTMQQGCNDAAKELGIDVTVLGPTAESEIAQQVTMIEEQLAAGVDAIVVAPCDESAVIGALQESVGKLPILAVDTDFALDGKAAFIGTGNTPAAKLGGVYAAEMMGEGGKAILIGGQPGEGTSTSRLEGFQQGLEENGATVLETQYGKNTADGAMAVMEDMLTKYPGEIGAVLAMNDDMIQGCQQAIKNAGVEGITLVGFNGDTACVELIQSGEINATVAQQPYLMGYQAVQEAYKAAMGETIEENQEVAAVLITKENAADYL